MAMTALQVARDTDITTQLEATIDPDWQVRRTAVQMMNAGIQQVRPGVIALMKDPQMHVRIEAIRSFARGLQTINDCAPIVTILSDAAPLVAMQAMDSLTTGCRDLPAIVSTLATEADRLPAASATTWHRPARALTTLARLAPEQARTRLAGAQAHAVWQVRATAATAAGVLTDATAATALTKDSTANVRTAAIDALARVKSPEASAAAIAALGDSDHQLVRAAARALQGSTHPEAVPALFAALRRLTVAGSDTSRDPRVAIVERLTELLGATRVGDLAEWTSDWDTAVRGAAVRAFTTAKVDLPVRARQFRYPLQPSVEQLAAARKATQVDIVLATGGTVTITLLPDEAPLTVARFVTRARAGVYDGLTFHRIAPNFVVQGLSPGANEYVGDDRFMRDEVGLQSHVRGAVGISTRGYDTGDAQIFFDLVDVPRLDHEYTVFGHVTAGLEHVDAMLEGAVVTRVVVRF
jgi:peptidylprolyl isomerase